MAAQTYLQPDGDVLFGSDMKAAVSALLQVSRDDATLAAIRQRIADGEATAVTASQMRDLGLDVLAEALAVQAGGS